MTRPSNISEAAKRRGGKSPTAFRTISEVADALDVPQHVLRFWESRFVQIKPLKRAGGRRYYRPEDVALLRRIRDLLYTDCYTIKGVQRLLKQGGAEGLPDLENGSVDLPAPRSGYERAGGPGEAEAARGIPSGPEPLPASVQEILRETLRDLQAMKERLTALTRHEGAHLS